jgi:hypothetical protein
MFDPNTGVIKRKPGIIPDDIGLKSEKLQTLKSAPQIDALNWRWEATQKDWKEE